MSFDTGTVVTIVLFLVTAIATAITTAVNWAIKVGFSKPIATLTDAIDDLKEILGHIKDDTQVQFKEHEVHLAKHDEQIKTLFERNERL